MKSRDEKLHFGLVENVLFDRALDSILLLPGFFNREANIISLYGLFGLFVRNGNHVEITVDPKGRRRRRTKSDSACTILITGSILEHFNQAYISMLLEVPIQVERRGSQSEPRSLIVKSGLFCHSNAGGLMGICGGRIVVAERAFILAPLRLLSGLCTRE